MGGRFVGKQGQGVDLGDDQVKPRESTVPQTMTGSNMIPSHTPLQHTMIQIQNNIPVMSSSVQNSAGTVASPGQI